MSFSQRRISIRKAEGTEIKSEELKDGDLIWVVTYGNGGGNYRDPYLFKRLETDRKENRVMILLPLGKPKEIILDLIHIRHITRLIESAQHPEFIQCINNLGQENAELKKKLNRMRKRFNHLLS